MARFILPNVLPKRLDHLAAACDHLELHPGHLNGPAGPTLGTTSATGTPVMRLVRIGQRAQQFEASNRLGELTRRFQFI